MSTGSSPTPETPDAAAQEWRDLTDRLVFDELWQRTGLTPRERSIVTVAVLFARGGPAGATRFHTRRAHENGLSFAELHEIAVHTAFYAGWPAGSPAVGLVGELWAEEGEQA